MFRKYLSRISPGILSSVVVIAILWLTLAPHPLPESDVTFFEHADKLVHLLMFGGLVFAFVFDLELYRLRHYMQIRTGLGLPRRQFPFRRDFLILFLFAVSSSIFGGIIELLQGWMSMGRGCDPGDFLADLVGSFLSAVISPCVVARLFRCR